MGSHYLISYDEVFIKIQKVGNGIHSGYYTSYSAAAEDLIG